MEKEKGGKAIREHIPERNFQYSRRNLGVNSRRRGKGVWFQRPYRENLSTLRRKNKGVLRRVGGVEDQTERAHTWFPGKGKRDGS